MKRIVFLLIACGLALGQHQTSDHRRGTDGQTFSDVTGREGKSIELLKSNSDFPNKDGSYSFDFETSDGIKREEEGRLEDSESFVKKGSYSYTAPDGTLVEVKYIADKHGFRPESPLISTSEISASRDLTLIKSDQQVLQQQQTKTQSIRPEQQYSYKIEQQTRTEPGRQEQQFTNQRQQQTRTETGRQEQQITHQKQQQQQARTETGRQEQQFTHKIPQQTRTETDQQQQQFTHQKHQQIRTEPGREEQKFTHQNQQQIRTEPSRQEQQFTHQKQQQTITEPSRQEQQYSYKIEQQSKTEPDRQEHQFTHQKQQQQARTETDRQQQQFTHPKHQQIRTEPGRQQQQVTHQKQQQIRIEPGRQEQQFTLQKQQETKIEHGRQDQQFTHQKQQQTKTELGRQELQKQQIKTQHQYNQPYQPTHVIQTTHLRQIQPKPQIQREASDLQVESTHQLPVISLPSQTRKTQLITGSTQREEKAIKPPVIQRIDSQQTAELLRSNKDGPKQDGSYSFEFETSDGIKREEEGRLEDSESFVKTGSYSYTAPEGTLVEVKYVADKFGFRPQSPLIPNSHKSAIPLPTLISQRAGSIEPQPQASQIHTISVQPQPISVTSQSESIKLGEATTSGERKLFPSQQESSQTHLQQQSKSKYQRQESKVAEKKRFEGGKKIVLSQSKVKQPSPTLTQQHSFQQRQQQQAKTETGRQEQQLTQPYVSKQSPTESLKETKYVEIQTSKTQPQSLPGIHPYQRQDLLQKSHTGSSFSQPIQQTHQSQGVVRDSQAEASETYSVSIPQRAKQVRTGTTQREGKLIETQSISRTSNQQNVELLRSNLDGPKADGSYSFDFETSDGTKREEEGRLEDSESFAIKGSYSYTAPEGTLVEVHYVADDKGYRLDASTPATLTTPSTPITPSTPAKMKPSWHRAPPRNV